MGIIEGITEFLPISSTGHMIIAGHFLKFEGDFAKLFEIVIQLGAILAVIVLYRKKIFGSLSSLRPGGSGFKLWSNIVVAFIPFGTVAFLLHSKVEEFLMKPLPVALALVVGGVWMWFAEYSYRDNNKTLSIDDVSYKQAFIIGVFQCMAVIWPGFSRSASTIIGGWIIGLSTIAATEFSFFLAIPTMIVATGYSLLKVDFVLTSSEIVALIVGFVVSFVVALVVIDKFIGFLKKHKMKPFAIYRILVGLVIVTMALFNIL